MPGTEKRRHRPTVGLRLSESARDRLKQLAAERGLSANQYLEALIMETPFAATDYYAQQAAVEAFIASGLSVAIAAQVLGVDQTKRLRARANELASDLFGATLRRPAAIGSSPQDDDPRVRALFDAFVPE